MPTDNDYYPSQVEIDVAYVGTLAAKDLTFGEYEALTPRQQDMLEAFRSRSIGESCGEFCEALAEPYGQADGLSDLLCKLWTWVVKVAKSVVEGVLQVVKSVVDAAFEILKEVLDAVVGAVDGLLGGGLGGILVLVAACAVGYYFLTKDGDGKSDPVATYPPEYQGGY